MFNFGVNQLGSELEGAKAVKTSGLGSNGSGSDNTNVSQPSVFDGTDAQKINQATFAQQMQGENGLPTNPLERAVGKAIHRGSKW